MKTITKGLGVIILIALLAFLGTCVFKMCQGESQDTGPEPPSIEKAGYVLRIKNTGLTFYAVRVVTSPVDSLPRPSWASRPLNVYTLPDGYWEANKKKFVFKKVSLELDERIFGEIEVVKR